MYFEGADVTVSWTLVLSTTRSISGVYSSSRFSNLNLQSECEGAGIVFCLLLSPLSIVVSPYLRTGVILTLKAVIVSP